MFFSDKIASCTSAVVIGVPMRACEVSGVSASFLGFPMLPGEVTGVPASLLGVYFSHLYLCIILNHTLIFIVFSLFFFFLFWSSDVP